MRARFITIASLLIFLVQACARDAYQRTRSVAPPPAKEKLEKQLTAPPPPSPPAKVATPASIEQTKDGLSGGIGRVAANSVVNAPMTLRALAEPEFNTEEYGRIVENAFVRVSDEPLSTFSVDVDRAAYANVRRYLLDEHKVPPRDAVRLEEMINYFHYDYAEPRGNDPVAIGTELADCPWNADHRLLKIGLQARRIDLRDVPPSNLVFLIDVSGSMMSSDKLPLIKAALPLLVDQLGARDRVSIVVYAGAAGVALPPTSGANKGAIVSAIEQLEAGGSTAGGEGIELAYRIAKENFIRGGNNRVILATDGDFNVGVTSDGELERLIEQKRRDGISLTVLGFGTGNIKDSKMELLADKGDGNYAYIDTLMEARKTLVSEIGGTLFTVAKDVKIQIEFNPQRVAGYRLLGYENRLLRAQDFNDDQKDAGEVGSGHSVTALYEIVPAGVEVPGVSIDPLKYQKKTATAGGAELLTLKVRYKDPDHSESRLITTTVIDTPHSLRDTTGDFRFAAAVAEFGMLLRGSEHRGDASYEQVLHLAGDARETDRDSTRAEFVDLVNAASTLSRNAEAR